MTPEFSLRSASEHDIELLWALRQLTMKPHIQKSYGWNNDEEYEYAKERLMCTRIIHINGLDIGIIKIVDLPDHFHLQQIQIHPDWSNRGIGSTVITDLIHEAQQKAKPVRLHVLKNNPAKDLYERLGFVVIEEFNHQVMMEYELKL
jgi:ribosomal protein S18 acetylase RimI-like enzyme